MEAQSLQAKLRPAKSRRVRLPEATIPPVIRESNLMKRGGFDVFEGLVDADMRCGMLSEAIVRLPHSVECEVQISDNEEVRGGAPRRRFRNATGGPYQEAFANAPWVLDFLRSLTTRTLVPTGEVGTYSYYIYSGDYLDIHRDILTCDVAVITCLNDHVPADGDAGRLCLYPERILEPLSSIRTTPDQGAVRVRVEPGQTIVLYGGIVPHALLPVSEGQARIISVLCYRGI
jgi:hypothetical protein